MTKYNRPFRVADNRRPSPGYSLLRLQSDESLPPMVPGQFVSVRVDGGRHTFLRRPFSIHDVDADDRALELLVQVVGEGSARIAALQQEELDKIDKEQADDREKEAKKKADAEMAAEKKVADARKKFLEAEKNMRKAIADNRIAQAQKTADAENI